MRLESVTTEVLELPPLGDAAVGFKVKIDTATVVVDLYMLVFAQGRIGVEFNVVAARDQMKLEEVVPLAVIIAQRIAANSPTATP